MPGNVFVPASASGLPKDSVVNVGALITLDKDYLDAAAGDVPRHLLDDIDRGLRQVLDL
jgi:mRNA interferase MazF